MSIDNMHFGFMPGKGTTDDIFIMHLSLEGVDKMGFEEAGCG